MTDKTFRASMRSLSALLVALAVALVASPSAFAEEGGGYANANVNVHDQASLQRGARLFMNYCVGCHSLKYLRYSQMADGLGLTEKQVMENLNFTGAKFGEPIVTAMPEAEAEKWFGKVPPDLSLEVSAKGANWVAAYLKAFYLDPATNSGWNNTVFPNVAMPNVLWHYQGQQALEVTSRTDPESGDKIETRKLVLDQPGKLDRMQYDRYVADLVNYLAWMGEPAQVARKSWGIVSLFFLALFFVLAWLLKREYWKDVH